jgi:two-component system sensor histidine kinase GlrK
MLGDKEKLQTVIDNLISNAIKYTPQSGNIRISIRPQGKFAVIEVHDSGAGVLASDRASLFDPFYRGDGMHESLVSGSGLGLSIAKEYVDAHGGEIALLPSELGAHFRVRLPLEISSV